MEYEDLPQAIRHAVGAHEAFRRLGFSASEIFAGTRGDDIIVALYTQGKEVHVKVGVLPGITQEKFTEYWQIVGDAMKRNEISMELFERIYMECPVMGQSVRFLGHIMAAGITMPRVEELTKIAREESN